MYTDRLREQVRGELEPVLAGMGYALVELSLARLHGATRALVVVHRPEGIGVEDCTEVSRAILPRLELIEELGDVSLEVSSPGIERTIKSPAEYEIFKDRGVRVLAAGETEWIGGTIEGAEQGVLRLRTASGRREFPVASVRRARLDYRFDAGGGRRPPEGRRG
jgi:ribosome maturation factor RimP